MYKRQPRLLLRKLFREFATAALDVSDGLLADAEHLANASNVTLDLELEAIPLSSATRLWLEAQDDREIAYEVLLSGGDDYEVVFTASPKDQDQIETLAGSLGVPVKSIGKVTGNTASVSVYDISGSPIGFTKKGYKHDI